MAKKKAKKRATRKVRRKPPAWPAALVPVGTYVKHNGRWMLESEVTDGETETQS